MVSIRKANFCIEKGVVEVIVAYLQRRRVVIAVLSSVRVQYRKILQILSTDELTTAMAKLDRDFLTIEFRQI